MFTVYNEDKNKFQAVPGNTPKEAKLKHEIYEEAGVREYWVVYPAEQNIALVTLNENGKYNGAKIYAGDDRIKSSAVKELIIKLNDVFNK